MYYGLLCKQLTYTTNIFLAMRLKFSCELRGCIITQMTDFALPVDLSSTHKIDSIEIMSLYQITA